MNARGHLLIAVEGSLGWNKKVKSLRFGLPSQFLALRSLLLHFAQTQFSGLWTR